VAQVLLRAGGADGLGQLAVTATERLIRDAQELLELLLRMPVDRDRRHASLAHRTRALREDLLERGRAKVIPHPRCPVEERLRLQDPDYERSLFRWNAQGKEALGLAAMALVHLPLLPAFPFFTATVELSIARYYYVHKRAHRDPGWAREHLPWHYDHHLGPNQDANWGVTWPWMDWIMKTREEYVGTDRERSSRERRAHGLVPESGAPMSLTPGTVTS
jgi:hypothetical protein